MFFSLTCIPICRADPDGATIGRFGQAIQKKLDADARHVSRGQLNDSYISRSSVNISFS
jgi:hypothetical protein